MKRFNKKQAGDYLGVGTGTIDRWMKEGLISYNKIGSKVHFTHSDLDAKIQSYPTQTPSTSEEVIEVIENKAKEFTPEELELAKEIINHLFKNL